MDDIGSGILAALLIAIIIFLVLREVVCWYWKINKGIELLERQNTLLEKLSAQFENGMPSETKQSQSVKSSHVTDENYTDDDDNSDISKDNLFK